MRFSRDDELGHVEASFHVCLFVFSFPYHLVFFSSVRPSFSCYGIFHPSLLALLENSLLFSLIYLSFIKAATAHKIRILLVLSIELPETRLIVCFNYLLLLPACLYCQVRPVLLPPPPPSPPSPRHPRSVYLSLLLLLSLSLSLSLSVSVCLSRSLSPSSFFSFSICLSVCLSRSLSFTPPPSLLPLLSSLSAFSLSLVIQEYKRKWVHGNCALRVSFW